MWGGDSSISLVSRLTRKFFFTVTKMACKTYAKKEGEL